MYSAPSLSHLLFILIVPIKATGDCNEIANNQLCYVVFLYDFSPLFIMHVNSELFACKTGYLAQGSCLLYSYNVVGAGMCLFLCLSWEWLKHGLCSQIDLTLCLLVVFRSSVFAFFSPKVRKLRLEDVCSLMFLFS